jgi:hypothetical protein
MSATERAEAKSVLQNCSSPDKPGRQHFFDASTGTELDGAFQKIIADIEGLVLTQ